MTEPTIADDVERRNADELIPYSNNPKEHPDEQVKKIASSIKNYGWDQPIVVDADGEIIKGHGRLQAAKQLGLNEVPVLERNDLSDAEVRAARLADNRTAESTWELEPLGLEIEQLEEDDIDLDPVGFDDSELETFLNIDEGEEPDPYEEYDESGLPEYENEDATYECELSIKFETEQDVSEFADATGLSVTPDSNSAYYPPTDTERGDAEYVIEGGDE